MYVCNSTLKKINVISLLKNKFSFFIKTIVPNHYLYKRFLIIDITQIRNSVLSGISLLIVAIRLFALPSGT